MNDQKGTKLNQLQRLLPEGLIVSAAWLEGNGYSQPLRSQYVSAGWLEQPARGVYRRPSAGRLMWQQVVISLQSLLQYPVVVGGRTALELYGHTHYVMAEGPPEVHLYYAGRLPGWVGKVKLDTRLVTHKADKLFGDKLIAKGRTSLVWNTVDEMVSSNDFPGGTVARQSWGQWDWPLTISTAERAILELLDEVPERETFHQVDMLMEGLRTLSPRRLQKLLEDCRSIKVKRLFLWFATRHNFTWFHKIDQKKIDLGAGKRMLVKGGRLDPKYMITVPREMHDDQ